MIQTTIFPGRYIQGANALDGLMLETKRWGENPLFLMDSFAKDTLRDRIFMKETKGHEEVFQKECCDEEIDRLTAISETQGCDLVVGIGGGKTIDTAKAVAFNRKVPILVVPTIASTDAPCSALSVIYHLDGQFKRYLFLPRNPDVVVVDTQIIAKAPVRFLVSGMGDALATHFEAESCERSFRKNMTGNLGSKTAYALARLCLDTLIESGLKAKLACEEGVVTPALEKVVEATTLLSGLGFESGGLACAHSIHNGLTAIEETHSFFHGEKVAFGVLTGLILTDASSATLEQIYGFCESVGLPTTLSQIGITKDTGLMDVALQATKEGETIHNEPFTVTPDKVYAALKAADAFGRARARGKTKEWN